MDICADISYDKGLALVEALARAGACVVVGDLNEELGQKEVKRLQAEGYKYESAQIQQQELVSSCFSSETMLDLTLL